MEVATKNPVDLWSIRGEEFHRLGCMSKHVISFLIGELKTIRLICQWKDCGAVAEVTIDRLKQSKSLKCPFCNMPYEEGGNGPLRQLGLAIEELAATKGIGVEFILPGKTAEELKTK